MSRHLTRTRRLIREAVERVLRQDLRMDDRAIAECFASVVSDPGAMDVRDLVGGGPDRKNDDQDRSS